MGGILSLKQVCIFEINIKFSIVWYPIWPISRKKMFSSQKGRFLNFPTQEPIKDRNTKKLRKIPFRKQSYISFANPNYMKHSNFQKFGQNHRTLIYSESPPIPLPQPTKGILCKTLSERSYTGRERSQLSKRATGCWAALVQVHSQPAAYHVN